MGSIHSSVLGRGLGSLIPGSKSVTSAAQKDGTPLFVAVDRVTPMVGQPRRHFDDAALRQLALSIREQGILQPLLVSPDENGNYALIAGERRWRAAQLAGLTEVPVVVRQIGPAESFEVALIENIQRQDLDAIEEAEAYERLIRELGYSHEALAKRVGKDRSTIANSLRLLKLPEVLRHKLVDGVLSAGHARALLGCDEPDFQLALAQRVEAEGLSVRAVEAAVQARRDAKPSPKAPEPRPRDPNTARWGRAFESALGRKVRVKAHGDGVMISIPLESAADVEALLERLTPH